MKRAIAILFSALLAASCLAGDIGVAWDAPTNNVDGSPVTDLAGYHLDYAVLFAKYSEVNGIVTSLVISTGEWARVWTTNITTTLTIPSTLYAFRVHAVTTSGAVSEWSNTLTQRVGNITTLWLRKK